MRFRAGVGECSRTAITRMRSRRRERPGTPCATSWPTTGTTPWSTCRRGGRIRSPRHASRRCLRRRKRRSWRPPSGCCVWAGDSRFPPRPPESQNWLGRDPSVFVRDLIEHAARGVEALSPLLVQWAGQGGERIREQIERAAALVPELRRLRVLGPLTLKSIDDQVRTTVGMLRLAKTLSDLGWYVEHEPVLG